jgi:hypothetical protein
MAFRALSSRTGSPNRSTRAITASSSLSSSSLSGPVSSHVDIQSDWTEPSTLRLVGAALGFPVNFYAPNIEPEEQAESFKHPARDTWGGGVDEWVMVEWKAAVAALGRLCEARKRQANAMTDVMRQRALDQAIDALLALQYKAYTADTRPTNPRMLLLSDLRGEAGETIAHIACLRDLDDIVFLLIDMEPMLMACEYNKPKYNGETLLHSESSTRGGGGLHC